MFEINTIKLFTIVLCIPISTWSDQAQIHCHFNIKRNHKEMWNQSRFYFFLNSQQHEFMWFLKPKPNRNIKFQLWAQVRETLSIASQISKLKLNFRLRQLTYIKNFRSSLPKKIECPFNSMSQDSYSWHTFKLWANHSEWIQLSNWIGIGDIDFLSN